MVVHRCTRYSFALRSALQEMRFHWRATWHCLPSRARASGVKVVSAKQRPRSQLVVLHDLPLCPKSCRFQLVMHNLFEGPRVLWLSNSKKARYRRQTRRRSRQMSPLQPVLQTA